MIDDQSDPGEWAKAIDRSCLAGRVSEYTPHIEDSGIDYHAWWLLIPGIPAGWGSEDNDAPACKPCVVLSHDSRAST